MMLCYYAYVCSVLELMYQKDEGCIRYEGRFKGLPLHSACGYGRLEAVQKLLDWDDSTIEYTSVPVILPAFTKTTESVALDPVLYSYQINLCDMMNLLSEGKRKHQKHLRKTKVCTRCKKYD